MKKNPEINKQEIIDLINIRNYIATIMNSNCKHITTADINELFIKLVEIDTKAMQMIKDIKI